MLYLYTRIAFKKIELAVGSKQVLSSTGINIGDSSDQVNRRGRHTMPQFFIQRGGRAFLYQLLVTALDATLTFTQVYNVSMCIGDELYLNMTCRIDRLL